ncbi:MAG TPA: hypothetical protein DHV28_00220 [Ignavibacteriales bacterium]|nr:hypothetical protein [Ignavibacteriales bacterium]
MKNHYKIFFTIIIIFTSIAFSGCDPFDDVYLTLALESNFSTTGVGTSISLTNNLCLSDFSDYEDNRDKLEEIRYITSAYMTLDATQDLRGDNLTLKLFKADGTTLLFQFVVPVFVANNYVNNPLKINLTQPEINNLNTYLVNPQEDKCFVATLDVSNVSSSGIIYTLNSKLEFLTELKIKP